MSSRTGCRRVDSESAPCSWISATPDGRSVLRAGIIAGSRHFASTIMDPRNQTREPAAKRLVTTYVGCAGWSVPKQYAATFPGDGTHLQRYAQRFHCVEINSSFYRSHRRATYQRWADATPSDFRFSVKLPKQITHTKRHADSEPEIVQFVEETTGLAKKLGAVLVQLPPSLEFDFNRAVAFFATLRNHLATPIACEPRHLTWFSPEASILLRTFQISRVAADPSIAPVASEPGGYDELAYFRWHGSPRMYYSAYDESAIKSLRHRLATAGVVSKSVWCIFDNTAEGAALSSAMKLADVFHGG